MLDSLKEKWADSQSASSFWKQRQSQLLPGSQVLFLLCLCHRGVVAGVDGDEAECNLP
jgi:hypothetical protein